MQKEKVWGSPMTTSLTHASEYKPGRLERLFNWLRAMRSLFDLPDVEGNLLDTYPCCLNGQSVLAVMGLVTLRL